MLAPLVANSIYLAAAAPGRARLARALRDPRGAQTEILLRLVRRNTATEFGREHHFQRIRTVAEFRERVPARDHDAFAGRIERIRQGVPNVLTAEPVRFVEPSGGSSGAAKEIPYTRSLLREFSAATLPWVFDLLQHRPALRGGRAYWAISPPARRPRRTPGGIPIGMEHDSDYFPAFARALLDRVLGVPRAVSRVPDLDACRYLTLRALLATPDLALISVWNPSFLALLADALDRNFAALLRDLETGALDVPLPPELRAPLARALPPRPTLAARLRRRFGSTPPDDLGELWTGLRLISCWTDAHAARALDGMRRRFPRVEVQGKGLLATEGVVSVPLLGVGRPVAALTSHFLEFLPQGEPERPRLAHELDVGATYEVLLTTGGGLYRYRLRDLVRVEGHLRRAPLLSFVGRADRASDLAGEKLTPGFVERVLAGAFARAGVRPVFALLAPAWGTPPRYQLYVEIEAPRAAGLAREVEALLRESHSYDLCRALGQLGPVLGVAVTRGEQTYERVCLARGQRAGAIKPPALDAGPEWEAAFASPAPASPLAMPLHPSP